MQCGTRATLPARLLHPRFLWAGKLLILRLKTRRMTYDLTAILPLTEFIVSGYHNPIVVLSTMLSTPVEAGLGVQRLALSAHSCAHQ